MQELPELQTFAQINKLPSLFGIIISKTIYIEAFYKFRNMDVYIFDNEIAIEYGAQGMGKKVSLNAARVKM